MSFKYSRMTSIAARDPRGRSFARGIWRWLTWFPIRRQSTRASSARRSENRHFPLSRADELQNTGTKTCRTGKFESSCGCFPKQIVKEYWALNSEQPNYAFYRIYLWISRSQTRRPDILPTPAFSHASRRAKKELTEEVFTGTFQEKSKG